MVIRANPPQIASPAMTSNAAPSTNPLLGHIITEKLLKTNYMMWKAQIHPVVRGARLDGILTDTSKEPVEFIITKEDGKEVKTANPAHDA
jgi:hypothetical protein